MPIIPTGRQNTMAAAAVVLLAAHFEEYIRQQIGECARAIIEEHTYLSEELEEKLIDSYWRSGASKLAAIRPKGSSTWMIDAESVLLGLVEYPIIGNVLEFRAEYLCAHDSNMRWDTVCELAGRVGVKSLSDLMFRSKDLKNALDNPLKQKFSPAIQRKMNSFYELRNGIVHSIPHNSGIGATIFNAWSEFFRVFTTAFASALNESFRRFESDIQAQKAGPEPRA